eukprot:gene4277-4531_t
MTGTCVEREQPVQVPLWLEQLALQQFDTSWLGAVQPSHARLHADRLQMLPHESLGLYAAPQPRISNGSLYKMEQRLHRGRQLDMQSIVRQLQLQFPEAQQPVRHAQGITTEGLWLDANGLLLHQPNPAKAQKERPWRRFDQDEATVSTAWVPAVLAPVHLLDSRGTTYRMDVELGKLEFEVHPNMTLEHHLAAKLLCLFREYHRRAALGLATMYNQKLAALEDHLLMSREQLFTSQEDGQDLDPVLAFLAALEGVESEVAEVRQLKEEEEALLLGMTAAMAELWKQLVEVRERQGGLRLTDVGYSVVQLPQEDCIPLQADGLTRHQLDVALLVAEAEPISGLPAYPEAFPLGQIETELTSFGLRRVECMASSHLLFRQELSDRLALLQDRVSADPDDPEIQALQHQLKALGPAPLRLQLTHQQEMELWTRAEEEVAQGRVGVLRPPRLQPCLTVLPATTQTMPRAAASLGSIGGTVDSVAGASNASMAGMRSRWGQSAAQQQLQMSPAGPPGVPPSGQSAKLGQQGSCVTSAAQPIPKLQASDAAFLLLCTKHFALMYKLIKLNYYACLLVNGRVVGTSEVVSLKEDFTLEFRDVFSIRMLKWPDSMQLELWEQHTFRDCLVAQMYLAIPGLSGTPHVDPQAKPYSWTSPDPVPHQKLLQAMAVMQPLGVLPAVNVNVGTQPLKHVGTSASADKVDSGKSIGSGDSSSVAAKGSHSVSAVYPSGRLFVRCGWIPESDDRQHLVPFDAVDGAFAEGQARPTMLHQTLLSMGRPHDAAAGGGTGEDGLVQVSVGCRSMQQHGLEQTGAPSQQYPASLFTVKAAGGSLPSSRNSSPDKARGKLSHVGSSSSIAGSMPDVVFGNPLADVEAGPAVAPPLPHVKADRALQRAAAGSNRAHGSIAGKWLSHQLIDPNDPKNALLLELLHAREAAAQNNAVASTGRAGDLFRLDMMGQLALAVDRVADQRAAFIRQRWQAGPYQSCNASAASLTSAGGRHLSILAPLSARDTLELQDSHREALALVEAASMGVGPGVLSGSTMPAAITSGISGGLNSRQDRALKWAQGALTKALEARETAIRAFALRIRSACNQMSSGRSLGRAFKTNDVVKDAPLPEFKLDLSSLAALLAPVRPLRPQRRAIKRLQASVPRDTLLVVTLQRASNLPCRLSAGGAGARQQSPNRTSGARFSNRFSSRDKFLPTTSSKMSQGLYGHMAEPEGSGGTAGAPGNEYMGSESGSSTGNASSSCLSCFVEVKFRGKAQRTAAVDSNMPLWNEQVVFPLVGLAQEASPSAMQESQDIITINVFDEVITPTAAAKAARAATRAGGVAGVESLTEGPALPERERRFLGCLRLPLAAVYQAEVVDGVFKLEVPPVLLGYLQESARPASLALYLTLKPRLAPPAEADEQRVSGEQEDVARHARKWVAGIRGLPQCRGRIIKALAVDPDGVGTLVCRYLAPAALPPPLAAAAAEAMPAGAGHNRQQLDGPDHLEHLMLAAARWVAHVPFLDDAAFGKRRSNVWSSNADFIGLAAGDHEEHAHLLACFFMQLQQQAFVVLGTALSVRDASCELRQVGLVYNSDNLWANIQLTGHPWDMTWNLADQNAWRPFFGPVLSHREMASIQPPPVYTDLAPHFYEELEARVEEAVRDALYEARSVVVTQPNNKLSRVLKALLKEVPGHIQAINSAGLMASMAMSDGAAALVGQQAAEVAHEKLQHRLQLIRVLQASHNERVSREMRGCLINGHILALPFSDGYAEAIAEAVIDTGVHRTVDPRVKFAMAAYVEPLGAAFVCCLWIYVAAIRETS